MGLATGGGQFKETLGYLRQNCTAWGFDYVHGLGVPHLTALTATFRPCVRQMDEAGHGFLSEVRKKALVSRESKICSGLKLALKSGSRQPQSCRPSHTGGRAAAKQDLLQHGHQSPTKGTII
jgi:hypothetical protein